MDSQPHTLLVVDQVVDLVGSAQEAVPFLRSVLDSLSQDVLLLGRLNAQSHRAELVGLLHQIKGYVPILTVSDLVAQVDHAESMALDGSADDLSNAMAQLQPNLQQLVNDIALFVKRSG